jgi:hypothetical protein
MLGVSLKDNIVTDGSMPYTQFRIICDRCDHEAFIFQNEGNFCLKCWQERTEPDIS